MQFGRILRMWMLVDATRLLPELCMLPDSFQTIYEDASKNHISKTGPKFEDKITDNDGALV